MIYCDSPIVTNAHDGSPLPEPVHGVPGKSKTKLIRLELGDGRDCVIGADARLPVSDCTGVYEIPARDLIRLQDLTKVKMPVNPPAERPGLRHEGPIAHDAMELGYYMAMKGFELHVTYLTKLHARTYLMDSVRNRLTYLSYLVQTDYRARHEMALSPNEYAVCVPARFPETRKFVERLARSIGMKAVTERQPDRYAVILTTDANIADEALFDPSAHELAEDDRYVSVKTVTELDPEHPGRKIYGYDLASLMTHEYVQLKAIK